MLTRTARFTGFQTKFSDKKRTSFRLFFLSVFKHLHVNIHRYVQRLASACQLISLAVFVAAFDEGEGGPNTPFFLLPTYLNAGRQKQSLLYVTGIMEKNKNSIEKKM